jgi:L-asparaginase
MRRFQIALFFILFPLFSAAFAADLPNIRILATGGTIAGIAASTTAGTYSSAQVGVARLMEAVPEIKRVANVTTEQVAQISSYDMTSEVWLRLALRVNNLLANGEDGVVITTGVSTLEETAYFLDLVVKSDKPVVVVSAMRPFNALSADGIANLYNAVLIAANKNAKGRGVLVTMNDLVLGARDVTQTSTTEVQAFNSPNFGPLGYVHDNKVAFYRFPERLHTSQTEFNVSKLSTLPRVAVIYARANEQPFPLQSFKDAKVKGIVVAGMGNGAMPTNIFHELVKASREGIPIVRSSRAAAGATTIEFGGNEYADAGFIASGTLNPQKAAILLQLALTKTNNPKKIQEMFDKY